MENNIQVFNNEEFGEVRTVMVSDEPWFVAADVCKALELSNPTVAVSRLDEDERAKFNLGRQGEGIIVNEAGLYSLILGSRKPEAKVFKRWITHDVIPAIRKTGGYIQGEESMSDDDLIARALVMAQKKIELREQQLKEKDAQLKLQKPKVDFADHVTDSDNAIDMGTFAKYAQKQGITMGRNTLFKWLRDQGVLMDNNVPYQRYLNAGWFRVIENIYNTGSGQYTTHKTLVTGRGQVALINYIRKNYKEIA
jgi:anti-repressor protein